MFEAAVLPVTHYIQVVELLYTPPRVAVGEPNRLSVRVRSQPMDVGPPCPVELVLSPTGFPASCRSRRAVPGRVAGRWEGDETVRQGIRFEEGRGPGTIELNIDGVQRAQTFQVRFQPRRRADDR